MVLTIVLSVPVGFYLAWMMDGRYRAAALAALVRSRLDTGPQKWKQYALALLLFNTVMFVFGFASWPSSRMPAQSTPDA